MFVMSFYENVLKFHFTLICIFLNYVYCLIKCEVISDTTREYV